MKHDALKAKDPKQETLGLDGIFGNRFSDSRIFFWDYCIFYMLREEHSQWWHSKWNDDCPSKQQLHVVSQMPSKDFGSQPFPSASETDNGFLHIPNRSRSTERADGLAEDNTTVESKGHLLIPERGLLGATLKTTNAVWSKNNSSTNDGLFYVSYGLNANDNKS